jgi:5-formyltetrahydrofolate cyclo-ligase
MPDKNELRQRIRATPQMPPDVRAEKSARLCKAIRDFEAWKAARLVAIFAPLPGEPDIEMLWSDRGDRDFAYPRVEDEWLVLHSIRSPFELEPRRWGLREPRADPATVVAPDSLDVILVPGLAFSRGGARLGRGRGYYDRLLAMLPAKTRRIGVCFDFQMLPELPVDPHDQHVDFITTESGLVAAS